MKRFAYVFLYALMGLTVISLSHCAEPGPSETEAEKNRRMLINGAWNVEAVTVGGLNRTALYEDLTINFTNSGYSATNGGSVWPASGTWQFINDSGTTIQRNDAVEISIAEISPTRLVLSMLWNKTTYGPGRTESVAGQHVFVLTH